MFYSQFILAKKGPLGTIWIAAHLERKLRKNQVADTDIGVSVDSILFPEMPIALRLSSHLLLGVARIYSRKVNYLFDDCSEALLKVKQAFRAAAVDLPPEESTAPYHSITLPETFDLDDFELPDNEIFQGNFVDHHISSKDQITLQDTMEGVVYSTSRYGLDERFGDDDVSGLDVAEEPMAEKAVTAEHATGTSYSNVDPQTSVQVDNASFKYDDNRDDLDASVATPSSSGNENEHLEDYDSDNEPVDYAQAPCTPGLWEEPNMSNIQETSACEDHHEPENQTITESAKSLPTTEPMLMNNLGSPPFTESRVAEHHNQFESREKSLPHVTTEQMFMNNLGSTQPFKESLEADHHNQFESRQKSLPHVTEQMFMNNLGSTQPFKESLIADHQLSQPIIANVEDLLNKNVRDKEPALQTVDYNHENRVEYEGNQENVWRHLTKELGSNTSKDNLVGNSQFQVFLQPKDSTVPFLPPHDSMASFGFPSLRPCVTLLNHETNVGRPHATEAFDMNLPQIYLPELGPNNDDQVASNISPTQVEQINNININSYASDFPVQVASNISTRQVDHNNINRYTSNFPVQVASNISTRQVDNNNININSYASDFSAPVASIRQVDNVTAINSYCSDYPAPEKLLSLPQGIPDVPRYFLPESTPTQKHIPTDYGTNMISGKKRSFTESSFTAQSLDLNQSSGFFTITTNATEKSAVNNNDLLSSILVGRKSSILKMKPTPPPPSTKRRRSTLKTGILKRKVVMDDNMVLHADTIRQQLINTEDIRRPRKKAPCSHSEISTIATQLWEDEVFYEPIFTGVSKKLSSLNNQLYDLSKFAVTHCDASLKGGKDPKSVFHNDESNRQLETRTENLGNVSKEYGGKDNFKPVTKKDVSEEQEEAVKFRLVTDNRTFDNNTTNLDYYGGHSQMHATGDLTEPFSSEHDLLGQGTSIEIDPKVSDTVMPLEVESLESLQMDHAPDKSIESTIAFESNNKSIESSIASEIKISVEQTPEQKHEQENEIRENDDEDEARSNAQNLIYDGIFGEDFVAVEPYDGEVNPVTEGVVSLDETENPGHRVTFDTTAINLDDIPSDNRVDDHHEITYTQPVVEHDTDFLNFDDLDDDEADGGSDYAPDVEATRVIDNTGWSSRTKAVAKYLQIMFDKEGEVGRNMISVNNLLTGKTRKEASRMFFETLVLKTKDYIHVEQAEAFEIINVFPRTKLLKSDF